MKKRLLVAAESGLVVFRDTERENPVRDRREDTARKVLRERAEDGAWFYIDAEDTVTYRLDVFVGEQPSDLPEHRFQRLGGTFGLDLDSGLLVVSGFEDWDTEHGIEPISVDPGPYSLEIYGSEGFDAGAYDREMEVLLGRDDVRFRQRIDRLGLAGCLSTVLAALVILIPFTRDHWPVALGVLAAGWIPYLLLQKLPRYRSIEHRVSEYEESLPHFAMHLERTDSGSLLPGGHIHV